MVATIHVIGDNDDVNEKRSLGCEDIQWVMWNTSCFFIHSISLMCFQCWWQIETLIACGGLSKNSVFVQEHSNITGKSSV